jgi:hypothetical protein
VHSAGTGPALEADLRWVTTAPVVPQPGVRSKHIADADGQPTCGRTPLWLRPVVAGDTLQACAACTSRWPTRPGPAYRVALYSTGRGVCACPDFLWRGVAAGTLEYSCQHINAARRLADPG